MNLWALLERAASLWPARDAVREVSSSGESSTRCWREEHERCTRLAAALERAGAGGARVAVLETNSPAYLETYLGAAGAGSILCPLNTRLAPPELADILREARPVVLVVGPGQEQLATEAAALAELDPTWLALTGADPEALGEQVLLQDDLPGAEGFRPRDVEGSTVAQLYFTSGTTGRSKGVQLTHGNVAAHALATVAELGLRETDVWGHVAPMFHLADAWASFAVTQVGGCHVFQREFRASSTLELFGREKVSITNLVPTMLVRVVAEAEESDARSSLALRLLLSGGAPIAPDVVERIERVLGCPYAQTYGMTETSPYLTISLLTEEQERLPAAEQLAARARTGRPFLGIELQVVDDSDQPVPRDDRSVGEIRVRGAHVSPGYWNRPEETARAFRDGWLYTGDLAVIDRTGSVDIVDRRKDMIVTGGENVYSIEVENVLHEHPGVLEAAVHGRPDPEWGERVCAAVVARPGAAENSPNPEALREFCASRLAGYKVPREVRLLEELPRTGSGKISKRLLRES